MSASSPPEFWMRRAVALSRRGFPAPNPHVGCVVVRDGERVGEGFHAYAGGPHAEIVALRQAGELARGSDVYVTLEPCHHTGRTGPCSLALIEARVATVTYAIADPNPRAQGGAAALRAAGIEVREGVESERAREANEIFLSAVERGRPFVVAKAAIGVDGRLALPSGQSQWITGAAARRAGHRLRAELGAVLVGSGTVLADDPRLTARVPGVVHPPQRYVWDRRGRLTGRESVFQGSPPAEALRFEGVDELLGYLFERGHIGLLVEGGAKVLSAFIAAGRVDRLELFLAPRVLGEGTTWVDAPLEDPLGETPGWRIRRVRRLGLDVWLTLVPNR